MDRLLCILCLIKGRHLFCVSNICEIMFRYFVASRKYFTKIELYLDSKVKSVIFVKSFSGIKKLKVESGKNSAKWHFKTCNFKTLFDLSPFRRDETKWSDISIFLTAGGPSVDEFAQCTQGHWLSG